MSTLDEKVALKSSYNTGKDGYFSFEITKDFLSIVLLDLEYQDLETFLKEYTLEQSYEVFLLAEREGQTISYYSE
ncbi:hypothetical protein MOF14_12735 [Bacillus spizizenii]|nr:hypothetical protein [Bacillus spizizenii]